MTVKKSAWESVRDRCPHCNGRILTQVRVEVWNTKRSGLKTKSRKKKSS